MLASKYESHIWEEILDIESVSTINVLDKEISEGIEILNIVDVNCEEELAKLEASAETKTNIRNATAKGLMVIIPKDNVNIGNWTGEGYTFFKMSDAVWTELENETRGNYDEIWKVNKKFIDEQISANKIILLSNNPYKGYYFDNGAKRFYQREIDYLISKGYSFEINNDGLWNAIKR